MVGEEKAFPISFKGKKILLPQRGSSTSCERFKAVQNMNPPLEALITGFRREVGVQSFFEQGPGSGVSFLTKFDRDAAH